MIVKTGEFNLSILGESLPFELVKAFGFSSGRDADKMSGRTDIARSSNGIVYLSEHTTAVISGRVVEKLDCGTHTLFVAEVTEARMVSEENPVTYSYYLEHIKPKPETLEKKHGWVCKVCGYIYEGEELPEEYICPLCKHGAEDFERV